MDDELSLPKATVYKLISEILPSDISCSREARDLVLDCCNEFVQLLAVESSTVCDADGKKTILPEHILTSLRNLGYPDYLAEVEDTLRDHKEQLKGKEKKINKLEVSGLSQEELLRQQELLFQAAKDKMQQQQQKA